MDSSVSPTHGEREISVWNGHYEGACYHPLFVFNPFGDLQRCALRHSKVHGADGWDGVLKPVVARHHGKLSRCGRSTFDMGAEWTRVDSEATNVGAAGISGTGAIGSASVRCAENSERRHVE